MRKPKTALFFMLFCLLPAFSAAPAHAFSFCSWLLERDPRAAETTKRAELPSLKARVRLETFENDSAVEIELDLSETPDALDLTTTSDGKVGGLLGSRPVPEGFAKLAAGKFKHYGDARRIPWEQLDWNEKRALLQELSVNQSFFQNRKVEGLILKKSAFLRFKTKSEFLGKTYPPGSYQIDISNAFAPQIEYMDPESVKPVDAFELHLRMARAAGELARSAWSFVKGLGGKRGGLHVHLVTALPIDWLAMNPIVNSALMASYVCRTNLAAAMAWIVQARGRGLRSIEGKNSTTGGRDRYFDSFRSEDIRKAATYFESIANGATVELGSTLKMGSVGIHSSEKYDQPGLWGQQYRDLGDLNDADASALLDAAQYAMVKREWGIAPDTMQRWLDQNWNFYGVTQTSGAFAAAWYDRPIGEMLKGAPAAVTQALGVVGALKLRALAEQYRELKFLVHDWSRDPLVFEGPSFAARILESQAIAARRFAAGDPIQVLISDFLPSSGLYTTVMGSVGVDVTLPR